MTTYRIFYGQIMLMKILTRQTRGICHNADRATGILYGPTALHSFISSNGLSMIIRGHECVPDGFLTNEFGAHNTIFSSPLYDDKTAVQ